MYSRLSCLRPPGSDRKNLVVFIRGFPDSPRMFASYYSETERAQPWLAGRGIHTYAFPNRQDNPNFPPISALAHGVLARELDQIMDELARQSPTGKLDISAE